MIQAAALRTNKLLLNVIQNLPSPAENITRPTNDKPPSYRMPGSPTPTASASNTSNSRQSAIGKDPSRDVSSPESAAEVATPQLPPQRSRVSISSGVPDVSMTPRAIPATDIPLPPPNAGISRPHSPVSFGSQSGQNVNIPYSQTPEETDFFDYQATVNELTIQFLSEFEETRVAALKWLIMLHQKAPKKVEGFLGIRSKLTRCCGQILAMDDGTFPVLLKTLSDSSEEVLAFGTLDI